MKAELDHEWKLLISQAKKIGLSIEEISHFLVHKGKEIHKQEKKAYNK